MKRPKFQFSLATLLKGFFIAAPVLAALVAYSRFVGSEGVGASASTANRALWPAYRLPATASDVTFIADFGGCEANFAISKAHFLQWCNQKGWEAKEIDTPTPFFQPFLLCDDRTIVTDGYTFQIPDGRGVFDAKRQRAAFWASQFP